MDGRSSKFDSKGIDRKESRRLAIRNLMHILISPHIPIKVECEATQEAVCQFAWIAFWRLQNHLEEKLVRSLPTGMLEANIANVYIFKDNEWTAGRECLSFATAADTDSRGVGHNLLFVTQNNINITRNNTPRLGHAARWLAGRYGCGVAVIMAGSDDFRRPTPKGCIHCELKLYKNVALPTATSKHSCFFCAALLNANKIDTSTHGQVFGHYPFPEGGLNAQQMEYFFGEVEGLFSTLNEDDQWRVLQKLSEIALAEKERLQTITQGVTAAARRTGVYQALQRHIVNPDNIPPGVRVMTWQEYLDEFQPEYVPDDIEDSSGEDMADQDDPMDEDEPVRLPPRKFFGSGIEKPWE